MSVGIRVRFVTITVLVGMVTARPVAGVSIQVFPCSAARGVHRRGPLSTLGGS
jgi:hypothetical protein